MQRKWIPALFFLAGINSFMYENAWVHQAVLLQGLNLCIVQLSAINSNSQAVQWTC
jgi:hypothetical protein